MYQEIDGRKVFVVEFDEMPKLPIKHLTPEDMLYDYLIRLNAKPGSLCSEHRSPYAQALNHAIETGIITKPGKYAIEITRQWTEHGIKPMIAYQIYTITEPAEVW